MKRTNLLCKNYFFILKTKRCANKLQITDQNWLKRYPSSSKIYTHPHNLFHLQYNWFQEHKVSSFTNECIGCRVSFSASETRIRRIVQTHSERNRRQIHRFGTRWQWFRYLVRWSWSKTKIVMWGSQQEVILVQESHVWTTGWWSKTRSDFAKWDFKRTNWTTYELGRLT